jgi:hypothetical protein
LHTVGDYFREDGRWHALYNDLGRRAIPDEVLWSLREEWGYDARGLSTRVTIISWYFERGTWWLIACLLLVVPLAALNVFVHWRTPLRLQAVLVALFAVGLVLSHILFVPIAFYRYLHPLPFFMLMTVVPLALGWRRAREDDAHSPISGSSR